jgi:hypothetical protein
MNEIRMIETDHCFRHSFIRALNSFRASRFVLRISILVFFLAVGAIGCGGARTSPVTGVVLLDGKPLAGATVTFVAGGTGRDATGETDKEGQFTMSTFEPRDGVLPGTYKVVISLPEGTPDPKTYTTSEDAMSGAAKAPAKKKAGPTIADKYSRADLTPLTQEVPVKGKVVFELTSK